MKLKITITLAAVVAGAALIGLTVFLWATRVRPADPQCAETMLRNLARGMITLSVKNGDSGRAKFASDLSEIKPYVMTKAYPAFPGGGRTGYGGYMVRLEEFPAGDGFRSNFRLIAYPAGGTRGRLFPSTKAKKSKNTTTIRS